MSTIFLIMLFLHQVDLTTDGPFKPLILTYFPYLAPSGDSNPAAPFTTGREPCRAQLILVLANLT